MKLIHSAIFAAALMTGITPAVAQNLPANTVLGRGSVPVGGGPAQAIPFSQLIATMLSGPLAVPSVNTNSIVFAGSTSGQATVQAQAVAGTPTINLPTGSGTLADSAALPLVLNASTGNLSCPTCATAGAIPVIASRAIAAGLDLHAASVVTTQGYATPGDGGGATFKNVGSAPFIDSSPSTAGTIVGGAGYVNGGYFGVQLSGGTGRGAIAVMVVSGGAVTSVNFTGTPGNAYSVGDVLTAGNSQIGGSGSGFTFTITSVTAPLGSFVDAVGTHWQYTPDQSTYPNIRQFGAVLNWNGNDATATDDFLSVQAALRFAAFRGSLTFDAGGVNGGTVLIQAGTAYMCNGGNGSLVVPGNVTLKGAGAAGGSVLKMCDSFNPGVHFVELCDPGWHFACFNAKLQSLQLFSTRTVPASNGVFMIHSNTTQDFGGVQDIYIYSAARGCLFFEKGYGGASTMRVEDVSCTATGVNPMLQFGNTIASGLNLGTTYLEIKNLALGGPSSGNLQTGPAILIFGGFADINGVHCENLPICAQIAIPATGNGDQVRIHNMNASNGGGTPCTAVVQLDPTNVPGNTILGMMPASSCTHVVSNGQSGGSNFDSAINLDMRFNP